MTTANKQAISGVTPYSTGEATITTTWPTAGSFVVGRTLGQLYNTTGQINPVLCYFVMLFTMPFMALIALGSLLPFINSCYRLTNRRVMIQRILSGTELSSITLDQFDTVDVDVLPGQEWYPSGDLIFRRGDVETFRLSGVNRPEAFRQICLKAHQAHVGVAKAMA